MNIKYLTGSYADMRRRIYGIKNRFPFAACSVCARSWAGRAIFTLGLGNQNDVALYIGCINAQHGETAFALLQLFENICSAYERQERICGIRLNEILQTKGILIVPCLNPDGMEMHESGAVAAGCYAGLAQRVSPDSFDEWRANAAGVDLNHNISSDWKGLKELEINLGYTAPGAKFYGGKVCISEPETRAAVKLCRNRSVRHIMTVGCGNNTVFAHENTDEKQALMLKIFGLCSGFETGTADMSVESHSGISAWFSAQFGKPAFSVGINFANSESLKGFEEISVLLAIM